MWHVVEHALMDTLSLLPWILLVYIVIELIENKTNFSSSNKLSGRLGPLIGSATGLIPQCGFSVMAAKLYEKRLITVGTLLAIFLSTSDEAFILLVSSGATGAPWVLPLLAVKIGVGVTVGYVADVVVRAFYKGAYVQPLQKVEKPKTVRDRFIQNVQTEDEDELECTSCGRPHDGNPWKTYLLSPVLHTLQVGVFILVVNFALGTIIHLVGKDAFSAFMSQNVFLQPFIVSAVGLIPNCASSVVITQTFLMQGISFGAFAGGLCANAGLGFVVLLKKTKKWKRNLALVAVSYTVSVAVAQLINLIMICI